MRFQTGAWWGSALAVLAAGSAIAGIEVAGFDIEEVAGVPFVTNVARVFPFLGDVPGDYTATIDWGDGTTASAGTVTANMDGTFDVSGSHTYAAAGTFLFHVELRTGADVSMLENEALVTPNPNGGGPAIVARGAALAAREDVPSRGVLATFVTGPGAVAPFSAQVVFDDTGGAETIHALPPAVVVPIGPGAFAVVTSQTTEHDGLHRAVVTVSDSAGHSDTATSYVHVLDRVERLRGRLALATPPDAKGSRDAELFVSPWEDTGSSDLGVVHIDWGDGARQRVVLTEDLEPDTRFVHTYAAKDVKRIFGKKPASWVVVFAEDEDGVQTEPLVLPDPFAGDRGVPKAASACSGGASPACFVESLFASVFHRRPTKAEFAALVPLMDAPGGRAVVVGQVLARDEARTVRIRDAYVRFLGLKASGNEVAIETLSLKALPEVEDEVIVLFARLMSSPKYFELSHSTNGAIEHEDIWDAQFVRRVAQDVLGRPADPMMFDTYESLAAKDEPSQRHAFAMAVLTSEEARRRSVHDTYETFLHRPPGPGEVTDALERFVAGDTTLDSIFQALVTNEILAAPPAATQRGTPDQRFVAHLYAKLLHRAADPAGLARWSALLAAGRVTRQDVAERFLTHSAYVEFEEVTFTQFLGSTRLEDVSLGVHELPHFIGLLAASPEYFAGPGGGTPAGWLDAVRRDLAGTTTLTVAENVVDSTGSYFAALLAAGASRLDVALLILDTPQARAARLEGLFQRHLGRGADATTAAALVADPWSPSTEAAILGSREYQEEIGIVESGIRKPGDVNRILAAMSDILGTGVEAKRDGTKALTDDESTRVRRVIAGPDGRLRAAEFLAGTDTALTKRVRAIYTHWLAQEPGGKGLELVARLGRGASEEDVVASIISSDAYFAHVTDGVGGSPVDAFLGGVFVGLLGRAPTANELGYRESDFAFLATDQGQRAALARSMLASQEFRMRFVQRLMEDEGIVFLHAKSDPGFEPRPTEELFGNYHFLRALASSPGGIAQIRTQIAARANF